MKKSDDKNIIEEIKLNEEKNIKEEKVEIKEDKEENKNK